MGSLLNSIKPLKKNNHQMLFKIVYKTEREGMIPNAFYEATITLIPKPGRNITEKENYGYKKFSIKYLQTEFNNTLKTQYTMI
jgi:hypothetical protein